MNIISTRTRAILYPFTGNNNREQTIRAEKLKQLGMADVIYRHELNAETLSTKIKTALKSDLDLDGVRNTTELLEKIL